MDIPFFHTNINELVKTIGYIGLFAIVFAESGLFFGFFLPGDSLLFTAGLLASQNLFNIYILAILIATAAILGDSTGYLFGRKIGPKIFNREDSLFFRREYLEKTQNFYAKYGARAIILGRFMPIVRTFVPILAGVGSMKYKTFLQNNIIGGLLWGAGVTFLGYYLGTKVPYVEKYLLLIIISIIILSFLPVVFEFLKKKSSKQ